MTNKLTKIYWTSTILFAAFMFFSVMMYLFKTDFVSTMYVSLGFPVYLLYINALAKFSGSVVLLMPRFTLLKEWTYAGFSFILTLAFIAHVMAGDGQWPGAVIGGILLATSYVARKNLQK